MEKLSVAIPLAVPKNSGPLVPKCLLTIKKIINLLSYTIYLLPYNSVSILDGLIIEGFPFTLNFEDLKICFQVYPDANTPPKRS